MTKISDLLTKEQVSHCCRIINNNRAEGKEPSTALRFYLGQFKSELEEKGVDSDYLAYMLTYLTTQEQ